MKIIALFCITLMGAAALNAQDIRLDKIEVQHTGLYRADVLKDVPTAGSVTGTHHNSTNIKFYSKSRRFPLKIGQRFGFDGILAGEPKGEMVSLKVVHIFPKAGLRNPQTGEVNYREEYEVQATVGGYFLSGYALDNDWELVPGDWTLQVWYGDKMLGEAKFKGVKP